MTGVCQYKMANFEEWISNLDNNASGAIEKHELGEMIGRIGITETHGRGPAAQHFMLAEGKRNIKRLVEYQKLGKIDYLKVCDLGKKIFKSYDTDCNAVLDTFEMTLFIDALLHEVNFASTTMSKS